MTKNDNTKVDTKWHQNKTKKNVQTTITF